jgi:hypothetical protein
MGGRREAPPPALAAVEREYFGQTASITRATSSEPARSMPPPQPFRQLLADTPTFLNSSAARYERACYVALPFGTKEVDGRQVDFDAAYHEVFEPAILAVSLPGGGSLQAVRADNALLSGRMSEELIRYLEYSRIVLADITAPNANVFYELGRRHRARATGTMVVAQRGARIPFDLGSTRVITYSCESSPAAEASRRLLTDAMQSMVAAEAESKT